MKSLRRSLNNNTHGHGNGHSHSNSHGQGAGPSAGYRAHAAGGPNGGLGPGGLPNAPAAPSGVTVFSNPLSRPTERVAPPQKVIKALASHRSTNPQQLSYTKDDFWYVIGEREEWYEALSEFGSPRLARMGLRLGAQYLWQTPSLDLAVWSHGRTLKSLQRVVGKRSPIPRRLLLLRSHNRRNSECPLVMAHLTCSSRSLSNSHAQSSSSHAMHSPTTTVGPTSAPTTPGAKRVSP